MFAAYLVIVSETNERFSGHEFDFSQNIPVCFFSDTDIHSETFAKIDLVTRKFSFLSLTLDNQFADSLKNCGDGTMIFVRLHNLDKQDWSLVKKDIHVLAVKDGPLAEAFRRINIQHLVAQHFPITGAVFRAGRPNEFLAYISINEFVSERLGPSREIFDDILLEELYQAISNGKDVELWGKEAKSILEESLPESHLIYVEKFGKKKYTDRLIDLLSQGDRETIIESENSLFFRDFLYIEVLKRRYRTKRLLDPESIYATAAMRYWRYRLLSPDDGLITRPF